MFQIHASAGKSIDDTVERAFGGLVTQERAPGMERDQFKLGASAWSVSVKMGGRPPDLIFVIDRSKRSTGRGRMRTTGIPRYRCLSTQLLADWDRHISQHDGPLHGSHSTFVYCDLGALGRVDGMSASAGCRRR